MFLPCPAHQVALFGLERPEFCLDVRLFMCSCFLQRRFAALRALFHVKGAVHKGYPLRLPSIRLASIGIRQVVHAQALYPTAVMDVTVENPRGGVTLAYDRLDSETHSFLCKLLGIPPNTPKALLWTECNLWPTRLYRDLRTLNFTRNFQESWLFKGPVRALQAALGHHDALRHGALRRLEETMRDYGLDLYVFLQRGRDKQEMRYWSASLFQQRAQQMYIDALARHSPTTRAHLLAVRPLNAHDKPVEDFPAYVTYGGFLSPIGLRFKAPTLRYTAASPDARPACMWCKGEGSEHGLHLIDCPGLPDHIRKDRDDLLIQIHCQTHNQAQAGRTRLSGRAHAAAMGCLMRFHWNGCTKHTIRRALRLCGRIINAYRLQWVPPPPDGDGDNSSSSDGPSDGTNNDGAATTSNNPIWPAVINTRRRPASHQGWRPAPPQQQQQRWRRKRKRTQQQQQQQPPQQQPQPEEQPPPPPPPSKEPAQQQQPQHPNRGRKRKSAEPQQLQQQQQQPQQQQQQPQAQQRTYDQRQCRAASPNSSSHPVGGSSNRRQQPTAQRPALGEPARPEPPT